MTDITRTGREFVIINLGFFICSIGIVNFLVPSRLAAGGVVGIATLLFSVLKLPVSCIILLLNIPIFISGIYAYGREYAVKCLYGIFLFPLYNLLSEKVFTFDSVAAFSELNPMAGAVISGVIVGIGIALPVSVGSNTGGTVILAQVMAKYVRIPVGSCIIIIDSLVVVSSVFIFGIMSALLALISLIITGRVINGVVLLLQGYLSEEKSSI